MKTVIIIFSVLLFVVILYLITEFVLFRYAVCRLKKPLPQDNIPDHLKKDYSSLITNGRKLFDDTDFEKVETTSFDGLKLRGLYHKTENAKGTIILFHGFKSTPRWDYAASLDFLLSLGFNLLYPYQRSHCESEGKYITYGVKERKDAMSWVQFINSRNGSQENIFMFGISMGCSTVLMGAGEGYTENVKGIIADCGFTSPFDIFRAVYKQHTKLPCFLIFPFFNFMCRNIAGFDYNEYSTMKALENVNVPVLFIHGRSDDFVPCEMTERNYGSYKGTKRIFTVDGAGHGLSYLVDTEGYKKEVVGFISEYSNN